MPEGLRTMTLVAQLESLPDNSDWKAIALALARRLDDVVVVLNQRPKLEAVMVLGPDDTAQG
jgi:hypothetical protein